MSRRVRKHANPFHVQTELGRIDPIETFGREAPLEIEVGSGGGAFLLERAAHHPERNFVGLEIRKPLVEQANARAERRELRNVRFFYANANPNLAGLAEPGTVEMIHVHFPDPCFKKRHQKRRSVQPDTVRAMATLLRHGGKLYMQSDVEPLAAEMYRFAIEDGSFQSLGPASLALARPVDEQTEWERQHEAHEEPIYRMLLEKVQDSDRPVATPEFVDTNPVRIAAAAAADGTA